MAVIKCHLTEEQASDVMDLLPEVRDQFGDVCTTANLLIKHDLSLKAGAAPIKPAPYRLSSEKTDTYGKKEVEFLVEQQLAVASESEWPPLAC